MELCFICGSSASLCSYCQLVSHCPYHLTSHRRESYCFPFTIKKTEEQGRFLVAVRDILPTELILREKPVSHGPYTKTMPQCLGCASRKDLTHICSVCKFPLCSKSCENSDHKIECQLFQDAAFKVPGKIRDDTADHPLYAAITVIRMLQLRKTQPRVYSELLEFQDHNEKRREQDPELWNFHQKHVVHFIIKVLKNNIPAAEINKIIGVMFTNSADLEQGPGYGRENGFYPNYAYMNHSCRCNTKTLKYPDKRLEVRAQVHIRKGQEISTQYVQSMKATFARRPVLNAKWFFDCFCERCTDPTECGTFLAAYYCKQGLCRGVVLPLSPCDGESEWSCLSCHSLVEVEEVANTVLSLSRQLETPRSGDDIVQYLERLLWEYSDRLTNTHYLNIQIKERLAILYGNIPGYQLTKLTRPQLDRKIQVLMDVLSVMNVVDPGYNKQRGKYLAELNKTRMLTVGKDIEKGILTRKSGEIVMKETENLKTYLEFYKRLLFC